MYYLIQQPLSEYKSIQEVIQNCNKYSPTLSIAGGTQKGKSLFAYTLAEFISKNVFNKEFDYLKNVCLDIDQLIDIVKKSKNEVIIIEETANQLNKGNWYDNDAKDTFFTLISQAFRKNLYIFCQPHLTDVSKSNRLFVNYQFVIEQKIDKLKACFIKPQEIVRVYWDLKGRGFYVRMDAPMFPFYYVYTEEQFKRGKIYTDWLEVVFKDDRIMDNLRRKRGLMPKEPEIEEEPLIINRESVLSHI